MIYSVFPVEGGENAQIILWQKVYLWFGDKMKDIHFFDGFFAAVVSMIIIFIIVIAVKSLFPSVDEAIILGDTSVLSSISDSKSSLNSNSETVQTSSSMQNGSSDSMISEFSSSATDKININTATRRELQKLVGIGEVKARAIIEYRERNGEFSSVDELVNVSGIGEKTLEKIRADITV